MPEEDRESVLGDQVDSLAPEREDSATTVVCWKWKKKCFLDKKK